MHPSDEPLGVEKKQELKKIAPFVKYSEKFINVYAIP